MLEEYPDKKEKKKKKRSAPMEYAASLLAKKAYSIMEVRRKMREKEYLPEEIEETVSTFIRHGFLNDTSFAGALAASLHGACYGKKRIVAKLREKGISSELIRETLEGREEEETSSAGDVHTDFSGTEMSAAEKALKSKWKTLKNEPDPRKRKEKALRFLAGRGFEAGICYRALDHVMQEENARDISGEDFI